MSQRLQCEAFSYLTSAAFPGATSDQFITCSMVIYHICTTESSPALRMAPRAACIPHTICRGAVVPGVQQETGFQSQVTILSYVTKSSLQVSVFPSVKGIKIIASTTRVFFVLVLLKNNICKHILSKCIMDTFSQTEHMQVTSIWSNNQNFP